MTDYIIIGVIAVILFAALWAGIKRLRGETGCCSGSVYKAHSRKLQQIAEKKVFLVSGMHCQHCVNRVMEAVNSIDGYSAVVHLRKGEVTVSAEQTIDNDRVCKAIEDAGYTVSAIR